MRCRWSVRYCRRACEAAFDRGAEIQVPNWFHQIGLCAEQNGSINLIGIINARAHDDFQFRTQFAQAAQSFQPIHARHLHVEEYEGGSATVGNVAHSLLAATGGFHLIAVKLEQAAKILPDLRRVVNYQNLALDSVVLRESGYSRISILPVTTQVHRPVDESQFSDRRIYSLRQN